MTATDKYTGVGTFKPRQKSGIAALIAGIRAVNQGTLSIWNKGDFINEIIERRFLWKRGFLINAPDVLRHILLDNADNYSRSRTEARLFEPVLGKGLITLEGNEWRHIRRAMAPPFSPRHVTQFAPGMVKAAREMLDEWDRLPVDAVVDVKREMNHLTFKVITRAMFSTEPDADLTTFDASLSRYQEVIRPHIADLIGLPEWFPRVRAGRARGILRVIDSAIDRILAHRRREGIHHGDLLDILMTGSDGEEGLSRKEIRDQLATVLVTGHETTANALTWTLYLLAQHPAEEAKLHTELTQVLDGCEPRHDDLPALPRLKMIIEEAMRLYPSVHTFTRQAIGPDRLRDRDIPAGTEITISPYVLHRHRRLWRKPDLFDPERFTPKQVAARPRFSYLPFGAGPRICLGAAFSMVESSLLLATIMQRYRMRLAPGAVIDAAPQITLRPRHGMPMLLERRHS